MPPMRPQRAWLCGSVTTALVVVSVILAPPVRAAPQAELWEFWAVSDPSSSRRVDHGPWQEFLERHVEASADGINRVRYAAVSAPQRQALGAYVGALAGIDPRELQQREQLAYWINLYNALTVQVVLRNPGKGSIRRMGSGFFSFGPWDDELLTVAGQALTLNDIEHRILRPIWGDRRIHYAVNCASLGCPNLRRDAYTAGNVMAALEAAEAAYINHDRGVSFSQAGGLRLSSIYQWYRADFAADEDGLLRYLAGRHQSFGNRLRDYEGGIDYAYDWRLNQTR